LQAFCAMACNGLYYGILSNYSDTYFLKQEEARPTTLHVTRVVQPNDLTLRECVYYISRLALIDNAGNRLGCFCLTIFHLMMMITIMTTMTIITLIMALMIIIMIIIIRQKRGSWSRVFQNRSA
jgi:hypothetical protein